MLLLETRLPPDPTTVTALPPTLLNPGLPVKDQKILLAQILQVEPPGGRVANSHIRSLFYIHGRGDYTSARQIVKWARNLNKAQEKPATCIKVSK
jgi:hypothetical protein